MRFSVCLSDHACGPIPMVRAPSREWIRLLEQRRNGGKPLSQSLGRHSIPEYVYVNPVGSRNRGSVRGRIVLKKHYLQGALSGKSEQLVCVLDPGSREEMVTVLPVSRRRGCVVIHAMASYWLVLFGRSVCKGDPGGYAFGEFRMRS
jgi:hypothetical protein